MGKKLTSRSEDYSKWYNELVVRADLAENSAVRGCMVIKPYGYAIWEKMQAELDRMFKAKEGGKKEMNLKTAIETYIAFKSDYDSEGLGNMSIPKEGSRISACFATKS